MYKWQEFTKHNLSFKGHIQKKEVPKKCVSSFNFKSQEFLCHGKHKCALSMLKHYRINAFVSFLQELTCISDSLFIAFKIFFLSLSLQYAGNLVFPFWTLKLHCPHLFPPLQSTLSALFSPCFRATLQLPPCPLQHLQKIQLPPASCCYGLCALKLAAGSFTVS